jgi:hypothetical protein
MVLHIVKARKIIIILCILFLLSSCQKELGRGGKSGGGGSTGQWQTTEK